MVVEQNSRGRIIIDKFEVKRLAVNYIAENFNGFECIDVKVKSPYMGVTLRPTADYRLDNIDGMRSELVAMFKERVHLDIKQLDITIL